MDVKKELPRLFMRMPRFYPQLLKRAQLTGTSEWNWRKLLPLVNPKYG